METSKRRKSKRGANEKSIAALPAAREAAAIKLREQNEKRYLDVYTQLVAGKPRHKIVDHKGNLVSSDTVYRAAKWARVRLKELPFEDELLVAF
jgi:hypothetical protein